MIDNDQTEHGDVEKENGGSSSLLLDAKDQAAKPPLFNIARGAADPPWLSCLLGEIGKPP